MFDIQDALNAMALIVKVSCFMLIVFICSLIGIIAYLMVN